MLPITSVTAGRFSPFALDGIYITRQMKVLHISEARCAGRSVESTAKICPERARCLRHKQLEIDRQMGLDTHRGIKRMTLPRVGDNACHYRIKEA